MVIDERRRLPIGVQSFVKLREGGFVYIDKTRYIYELTRKSTQYFLSRPRRFGKSLFLSTLKASRFTNGNIYATEALMTDYRVDNPDPVPLLYQTVYLTIYNYDARRQRYVLGFPNDEVKYGFLSSLLPVYTPASTAARGTDIFTVDEYIENGKP